MKLNFPEPKNDFTEWPTTAENEPGNTKPLAEGLTGFTDWQADAQEAEFEKINERKARKERADMADKARTQRERAETHILVKMGRLMQDNIITAGRITERVLLANRDGRPPEEIALLAVKGLSLLVRDPLLYSTIAREYEKRYGLSLQDSPPYEVIRKDAGKK